MEIENYEESLKGLICTGKENSSRCPFLKHQFCQRATVLLTGALFELSQDFQSIVKRKDIGAQGSFVTSLSSY